jgi:mono/diheme cytochrome c family protein
LVTLFAGGTTLVSAQDEGGSVKPSQTLPIQHPSGTKLTAQQERGANLFIQRCSLCHLGKTFGAGGSKQCCTPSLGPDLSGSFKNATPAQEKMLRETILNGGPSYMPGWKYGLESNDIEDIIAYLKMLG